MHIEPGLVDSSKLWLSYATASGAGIIATKLAWESYKEDGAISLLVRSAAATSLVFCFFEVFPHYTVGISEVHLILGATLFLILGIAPTAIGLALGLLIQGVLFAPFDLPQFGMNVTTLLIPLFGLRAIAEKIIAPATPYVDLKYRQVLALSTSYQTGVVGWVAFWSIYAEGFSVENIHSISVFGGAYMVVIVIESIVELLILRATKTLHMPSGNIYFERRLVEAD